MIHYYLLNLYIQYISYSSYQSEYQISLDML